MEERRGANGEDEVEGGAGGDCAPGGLRHVLRAEELLEQQHDLWDQVSRWSGGQVARWSGGQVVRWPGGQMVRWSGGQVVR